MTHRIPSRRGFTLIEVMIVIGIIAMVMMAGIPLLSRALNRDQLAKAVNDVLEGCKLARDRAVLRNQAYDFVIRSKSQDEWDMNVEPSRVKDGPPGTAQSGGGGGGDASGGVKEVQSLSGDFPRPFGRDVAFELIFINFVDQMAAGEARVRFFPNGTADEFTLIIHSNGKRRTIKVDIITGAAFEVVGP